MKIKIRPGNYPTVVDGEYTHEHFTLGILDDRYDRYEYVYDGDLIVPGFAQIHINSQTAIIEVARRDYICKKELPRDEWKI